MPIINRDMSFHGPAILPNGFATLPAPAVVQVELQTAPQHQHQLQPRFFGELIESLTGIPEEVVDIAAVGAAGLGLVAAVAAPFVLPAVLPALGVGAAVAGGVAAAEGAAIAGEAALAGGVAAAEGAALAGEAAMVGGAAAAEGAALAGEAAMAGEAVAAAEGVLTAEEAASAVGMTGESMSSLDLGPPLINIPRDIEVIKMPYVAMVCPSPDAPLPACRVAGEWRFGMNADGSGPEIEPKEQLEIMRAMLKLLEKPHPSEFQPKTARRDAELKEKKADDDEKPSKAAPKPISNPLALWVDLNKTIRDLQEASLPFETASSEIEDIDTFTVEGHTVYHDVNPEEIDEIMRGVFMEHLFPITEHPVKTDDDNDDYDVVRELLDFGFSTHKNWLDLIVNETLAETPAEIPANSESADEESTDKKRRGKYVEVTM